MAKRKKEPTFRGKPINAVMNIEKGEAIAGMWVSAEVPGIGIYKLLAKRTKDGTCEWAHFAQRADGTKDKVYRGTVDNESRLAGVVDAINSTFQTTYGPRVRLREADADIHPVDGGAFREPPDKLH